MRRKIIRHVLIILFLSTVSAYAQEAESVNDIVVKMKNELNLTQQQTDAVKPIIEEDMARREELRQGIQDQAMITDRATIESKIEQLDQDENQKLSQILTKDQMNKWIQKQRLKNAFNKDRMDDTRWKPEDEKHTLGINF